MTTTARTHADRVQAASDMAMTYEERVETAQAFTKDAAYGAAEEARNGDALKSIKAIQFLTYAQQAVICYKNARDLFNLLARAEDDEELVCLSAYVLGEYRDMVPFTDLTTDSDSLSRDFASAICAAAISAAKTSFTAGVYSVVR